MPVLLKENAALNEIMVILCMQLKKEREKCQKSDVQYIINRMSFVYCVEESFIIIIACNQALSKPYTVWKTDGSARVE